MELNTPIKSVYILKVFLFLFGVLFLFLGVKELGFRIEFIQGAQKYTATVLSVEQKQLFCAKTSSRCSNNLEHYGWAAINVSYINLEGDEVVTETSSIIHNFFPGIENINIYLSNQVPEKVLVANPFAYWLNSFVCIFLAIFFLIISLRKGTDWFKESGSSTLG